MRKLRFVFCATAVFLALLLPLSGIAGAAATLENDNHVYDTADYCLRAHDVRLTLSEVRRYESAGELEAAILKCAQPVFLIRDGSVPSTEWKPVLDNWAVDFSQFQPEVREEGYPVVITLPELTEGLVSSITFRVYVTEDEMPPDESEAESNSSSEQDPDPDSSSEPDHGSDSESESGSSSNSGGHSGDGSDSDDDEGGRMLKPVQEAEPAESASESAALSGPEPLAPSPAVEPSYSSPVEDASSRSAVGMEETAAAGPPPSVETGTAQEQQRIPLYPAPVEESHDKTMTPHGKEGSLAVNMLIVSNGGIISGFLGVSIASDLGVLRWYRRKKRERREKL